ncbi:MAG: radical SAM protein [Candidatus Odinarchaeota archaeon]
MATCRSCRTASRLISEKLGLCRDCALKEELGELKAIHDTIREKLQLGSGQGGLKKICNYCLNECHPQEGSASFCGLKRVENGEVKSLTNSQHALLHAYKDRLPTNCCSSWFCPRGTNPPPRSYNLAVFFYCCTFHCLFCQNHSHWYPQPNNAVHVNEMVDWVKQDESIACVCYFGGTPEPHFPFALEFSRRIAEEVPREIPICFEWNGSGRRDLVLEAAKFSIESGGNIKFDLKAWSEPLHVALTGHTNQITLDNFSAVANLDNSRNDPFLTATTLLVPGYVTREEVEQIAAFIAGHDPNIPYSLLVFHPGYLMRDLPVTPRQQALECYEIAKKHLNQVHLGNVTLLGLL